MKYLNGRKWLLCFSAAVLMCSAKPGVAQEGKNYIRLYGGMTTDRDLKSLATLQYNGFINSYLSVFCIGRKLKTYDQIPLRWEVEGQIAKHWGYQQHWETNAVLILRWLKFPWDHRLDTSLAIGDGLSYASEKPKIELDKMGKTSNVLNYLMLELACVIPKHPNVSLFGRIHHRSGVFGLINHVSGGSNMVTTGIRVRF